jgi:hypothetical protein
MAKKKPHQEDLYPGKLLITEGIGHHMQGGAPPCKSGMAQEEHSQKRLAWPMWYKKSNEDGRSGGDISRNWNTEVV